MIGCQSMVSTIFYDFIPMTQHESYNIQKIYEEKIILEQHNCTQGGLKSHCVL